MISADEIKSYLRIEHAIEDALIASLLAEAIARIEAFIRRPIADGADFFDPIRYPHARSLRGDRDTASTTTITGSSAALATLPDYGTRIEPMLNGVIRDLVSDAYQRRNPLASGSSTAGASVSYDLATGFPRRALPALLQLRGGG